MVRDPLERLGRSLIKLRAAQAKRVMPLIGPLIDAWDGVANDVRSDLIYHEPEFVEYLERIIMEMEK